MEYPPELFEGTSNLSEQERSAIIGRYAILHEMGFFGDDTNIALSVQSGPGRFAARVRKRFSGTYGNVEGCSAGDIEVAGELLGVFDEVFDFELETPTDYSRI